MTTASLALHVAALVQTLRRKPVEPHSARASLLFYLAQFHRCLVALAIRGCRRVIRAVFGVGVLGHAHKVDGPPATKDGALLESSGSG